MTDDLSLHAPVGVLNNETYRTNAAGQVALEVVDTEEEALVILWRLVNLGTMLAHCNMHCPCGHLVRQVLNIRKSDEVRLNAFGICMDCDKDYPVNSLGYEDATGDVDLWFTLVTDPPEREAVVDA